MGTVAGQRAGFALAVAIIALVMVGAIVTGGFYALGQGPETGAPSWDRGGAFHVAESGLHEIMGNWKPHFLALEEGSFREDTVTFGSASSPLGMAVVRVHRLSDRLYFLESTGSVFRDGRQEGGSRTLGMLVRVYEDADSLPGTVAPIAERSWVDLSLLEADSGT